MCRFLCGCTGHKIASKPVKYSSLDYFEQELVIELENRITDQQKLMDIISILNKPKGGLMEVWTLEGCTVGYTQKQRRQVESLFI